MNLADITLLLGVDARHLEELRWVWPTWMQFKPELRSMPCLVFYDPQEVKLRDLDFLNEHDDVRTTSWRLPNALHQRERMLTGFVQIPGREVETAWYLKIDTDVVATGSGPWLKDEWFLVDSDGEAPVFISSKWHYTKPRFVMDLLDYWADGVPELARRPRLDLPYSTESSKLKHPRIISWFFIGRTDWTASMAMLAAPDGRLPWPSQDSFLFYCAERLGSPYVREQMSDYHWSHKRFRQIRDMTRQMGFPDPGSANLESTKLQ